MQLYNVTENNEPFITNMTKKEIFGMMEIMAKCRKERGLEGKITMRSNGEDYTIYLDDRIYEMERSNG